MCWPTLVLNLKTLLVVVCAFEYGEEPAAALLRLLDLSLPMLTRATERFGHALNGHGDACHAAGEYVAALRAQRLRPDPTAFARLRGENSRCVNLR